jgi:hypothetical protein
VELFDPFDELTLGPQLKSRRPEHVGRFAPLLGLLVDEAGGASHAIDFLHPRKKVEKADNRRRNLLIATSCNWTHWRTKLARCSRRRQG